MSIGDVVFIMGWVSTMSMFLKMKEKRVSYNEWV